MAHYNFRRDLADGKIGEKIVERYLKSKEIDGAIVSLDLSRQKEGDLSIGKRTIEVKFDKMAESTSNMCFEVANGKGDSTGIASTKAHEVCYVVTNMQNNTYLLFFFKSEDLRSYLYNKENVSKIRVVQGGDRRAYTLMLVSVENIIRDKVAYLIEEINAEM